MNTEQKLLVALVGNSPENEIKSLFSENLDWSLFIRAAAEHRIIPAIFQNLRRFSANLPPEIYIDLQNCAEKSSTHNLKLNGQLISLAKLFEENKIEFISYKGATLARLAYGDTSLRQFGDLDLLIHKKDFPKVKRLILENGGKMAWNLSDKQEKAVLKYYYEFPFKFGKNPVLVEIHWAFMESFFGFDYEREEVFRRSQIVSIHGKSIPTLSNEDLLIVLCVHGSKHFWKRLSWICDVGKLVEAQPIDWNIVIKLAEKFGCVRMLALGLLLTRDFLRIDLPEKIQRLIANDKEIESLAEQLKEQIFDDKFSAEAIRSRIHLKMRERRRDKFTYSRRLLKTKLIDSLFMPMGRPQ
jgi:hypothetical protein